MDTSNIGNKSKNQKNISQQPHKSDESIRLAIQNSSLGVIVAHIDCEQRYTFIYNSHPDFCAEDSLGKRDDEIELNNGNIQLFGLKQKVIDSGVAERSIISFPDMSGERTFHILVTPLYDDLGNIEGATSISVDITDLIKLIDIPKCLTVEKGLSGTLSLCSFCKNVRNDDGDWERIEAYISHHSEAQVSHGLCPQCMEIHYPDVHKKYTKIISSYAHPKEK